MTDGYFLPKHEQDQLVELLDQIPPLIEDLTIALTRQDRITTGGPRVRTGSDEQPLPIGIAAMDASDLLHDTLTAWVRHVCEQRHYPRPRNDTLTLGRWLKQHVIALALTPGAEESLDEIRHAIRKARAAVDKPREKKAEWSPEENLEAVGLTKDELREAIYARVEVQVKRKDLDNWIRRGHVTKVSDGYYSLTSAIRYILKQDAAA